MSPDTHLSLEHRAYLRRIKRKNIYISLARWGILLIFILLWELAANWGWIDPFIVSSPSRVVKTIASLASEGNLWNHIGLTVGETIIGFLAGTILGTLVAVLLWWSESVSRIFEPYLVVLNSLPKIALGPIIIVWIGAGIGAIIVMALLISIVVTIMSVLNGFLEVSREETILMRTFRATKLQIFTKVILPASIPTIISTLKINVGMSWIGVIVAEFLVSGSGLGYLIVYGGQVFKLDLVMTGVIILAIAAALMYQGVAWIEKRYLKGHKC